MWPFHMMIIAAYFMLREIEASAAEFRDVSIDRAKRSVTWFLPTSKTDARAHGCKRTWKCICSPASSRFSCPYCLFVEVEDDAIQRGSSTKTVARTNIFHTSTGGMTTKAKVVKTIQHGIDRTAKVDASFLDMIASGQSIRRAGACWMAQLGLDLPSIQLVGRWDSAVVMRYVAEAPLERLSERVRSLMLANPEDLSEFRGRALAIATKSPAIQDTEDVIAKLDLRFGEYATELDLQDLREGLEILRELVHDDVQQLQQNVELLRGGRAGFVHRIGRHRHHRIFVGPPSPPECWRTRCGWAFSASRFSITLEPGTTLCRRCFAKAPVEEECTTTSVSGGL